MIRIILTTLLMCSLASGCGIIILIGEPVKHLDLSSVDDAEENLKAVRAMLEDQATHRPEHKLSNPPTQPSPPDGSSSLIEPSSSLRPTPSSSSSSTGRVDVPAKLPWTPTAPDRPTVQDRPVPAYTTPAPVGPDSLGAVRCAPDGLGGQRCFGR